MAIDGDRGKGLLLGHDIVERVADLRKLRRGKIGLLPNRRETGGKQQRIVLTQGDVERRGQADDHVATGRRASDLQEAQMTLRDVRVHGKIELRQSSALAPPAKL